MERSSGHTNQQASPERHDDKAAERTVKALESEFPDPDLRTESNISPPSHSRPSGASASRTQRDTAVAIASATAYLALFFVTPHLRYSQGTVVIATLLLLALSLVFVVTSSRALRTQQALTINSVVASILVLPLILIPILFVRFPGLLVWKEIAPLFRSYRMLISFIPGLKGLLMIWLAACAGTWISRLLKEMKILLPIAIVLACMDLYVVFGGGLVTQANTGKAPVAQAAMNALSVHLPRVATSTGAAPMELSVGFADFLFIALFFSCFARFGIPSRRTFIVLCTALVGYLTVVYIRQIDLPALVPIAVVVVGMNLRAFRYERSEAYALLYAGFIVLAVLGGLYYMSHK